MRTVAVLLAAALVCAQGAGPSEREQVLAQMSARPNDFWPRGSGHVVLGLPGSPPEAKAYHEPGGSFSPAPGSFGLSLWVMDGPQVLTTSDTIPLAGIEQSLSGIGVRTRTPYYTATWSLSGGPWVLEIDSRKALQLVVRSVGPAGGPIRNVSWNGELLRINGSWVVAPSASPRSVVVGDETQEQWKSATSGSRWEGESGWGFARLSLGPGRSRVEVSAAPSESPLPPAVTAGVALSLGDKEFEDCFHAQVAHLAMGLAGVETRPGETVNYPLAWLRDGSYTLTALARAGRLDLARALSRKFAEEDFFGGFGAEADAPGLALWALEEVASRLADPDYDAWLWPHAERKASLIEEMLTAQDVVRKPYTGPIVPRHRSRGDLDLVAEPSTGGLINGRMDHHRPLLFVNAVSYRGLLSAAQLALRANQPDKAARYRAQASALQTAWIRAFADVKHRDNDRTYISALWPTGVARPMAAEFRASLESRDPLKERPLWTYFTLAEAHQWLLLGQPERAWNTVRWFWANQASPGLYTWWEGEGEENSFGVWDGVRGWVKPPHVTPHYWTASEMLLLQLDMLAYLDGDTLVVGAGVPADWLGRALRVRNLQFGKHRVDWEWNGKRLKVDQHGGTFRVRHAGAFAK